ncbi:MULTISPECIES: hypothetical protein [Colwellia]|jgi:hypothetical protein|uniref:Uncharacterized protein n=1 Tax=Colwellia psychrerythraea (strain 34H / ATCC BAA-681) TaxID=167879 RepID=Q482T2_COLP3|nr:MULTISPECIES: hypothetical protein [Colwellia]AAZ24408.1 hypothetical protein CPS_2210 [Colwellia psychrerythraea 34H]PKH87881.1 hypothetical protein CXF79_14770 [Colwellia sp. Bg11-28]
MSFFAYFYQLKASLKKFLNSNKTITPKQEKTKYDQEINANLNYNLRQKCKRAAQEIRYTENFTHWPITEAKLKKEAKKNSLIYLDVTRKKRMPYTQNDHSESKVIAVIDKGNQANKVVVIKKHR